MSFCLFTSQDYPLFTHSVFQALGPDPLMGHEINLMMSQDET